MLAPRLQPWLLRGVAVAAALSAISHVATETRYGNPGSKRLESAGATVVQPAEDQFWGDRYGVLRDPFGYQWSPAETVREVDMDEVRAQMASGGQPATAVRP